MRGVCAAETERLKLMEVRCVRNVCIGMTMMVFVFALQCTGGSDETRAGRNAKIDAMKKV